MWRRVAPFVGALLFVSSVAILARELEHIGFAGLTNALRSLPPGSIAAALLLTLVNYAVLTLQDQLAITYAGVKVPRLQVSVASFMPMTAISGR